MYVHETQKMTYKQKRYYLYVLCLLHTFGDFVDYIESVFEFIGIGMIPSREEKCWE